MEREGEERKKGRKIKGKDTSIKNQIKSWIVTYHILQLVCPSISSFILYIKQYNKKESKSTLRQCPYPTIKSDRLSDEL